MKPKFYVTSSNLDVMSALREVHFKKFIRPHDYDKFEYANQIQFEVGYFKFIELDLHLILKPFKKFCPFCLSESYKVFYNHKESPLNSLLDPLLINKDYHFWVECMNCGSRGPLKELKINSIVNLKDENDEIANSIKDLVITNWSTRPEYDQYCEYLLDQNKK